MSSSCKISIGDLVKRFSETRVGIVISVQPHAWYVSKDGCNDWITYVYPDDWKTRTAMAYELDFVASSEEIEEEEEESD
jgi:hypothetical protein